jgi:glutamate-1-semialdehyde aminotransferase
MFKIRQILLFAVVLLSPVHVESIVYLRKTNERGPTAAQAGFKCLQQLANVYFYNLESTQASNLGVFIAKNMSSPAQEIVGQYLEHMHRIVFSNQEDEQP